MINYLQRILITWHASSLDKVENYFADLDQQHWKKITILKWMLYEFSIP